MERVNYDERLHAVYVRGRAISAARTAMWMRTFTKYVPARRPLTVLDLGSGTGRFSPALADTFGGPVYGVEPSSRMRAVAVATPHPKVSYVAGSAERIRWRSTAATSSCSSCPFITSRTRARRRRRLLECSVRTVEC
ncbi:MAG: class I SAM-dependent methyltransferase [Pseudonocardiaceae bacterium]